MLPRIREWIERFPVASYPLAILVILSMAASVFPLVASASAQTTLDTVFSESAGLGDFDLGYFAREWDASTFEEEVQSYDDDVTADVPALNGLS